MAVDQAGHDGGPAQVDDPGAGRNGGRGRLDGADPVAADEDRLVPPHLAAVDVHQPARPDRDQRRLLGARMRPGGKGAREHDQREPGPEPRHGGSCGVRWGINDDRRPEAPVERIYAARV